jgi:serine phosphatase RsbU (regulator of sigma subunit)
MTLFLAQLDPRDASLVYSSAGHRCDLLGPNEEVEMLDATSLPLGIMPLTVPAATPRMLQAGQIVLFLTDGFEDTVSPEDLPFGVERTLEVVRAHRHRRASGSSKRSARVRATSRRTRRSPTISPRWS